MEALPLRLTAFAIMPLVIILIVGGVLSLQALEASFERRLQQEVEMVARALRLPVSDALRAGRFDRVQRSLQSAGSIGRVYGISVYDSDGSLVAALGGASTSDAPEVSRILKAGERAGDYETLGGREVYSYFVPLAGPGERMTGLLHVTRRQSEIREFMQALRLRGAGLLAAGVLLMTVIVIFGHYVAVGRSLRGLERSIRRVECGEREHRTVAHGPREVASVARSFNAMLDSIDEAEHRATRERHSRELLEEELGRTEKLAAIGRLAGGLAHELGTPLSLVDGHAQRALRDPKLPLGARKEIETTRREVDRMSRIVRQLLDYGRRAGRREPAPVEASRLATMALTAITAEADSRGVSIVTRGDERGVKLWADDTRLEQALINIVRNAIQAAHSRVEIAWEAAADAVRLTIDDDGPGVDPAVEHCLFEPFVTTRGSQGGTGLGLAIAHSAAQEHGGTLELESSPLGGARFELSLPRSS